MDGVTNPGYQSHSVQDVAIGGDNAVTTRTQIHRSEHGQTCDAVDLGVGSTSLDLSLVDNSPPPPTITVSSSSSSAVYRHPTAVRLKPQVRKTRRHLRRKTVRQVMYSLTRNCLCYIFLVFVIVVGTKAKTFRDWDELEKVIFVALMSLGLVGGIPFQLVHIRRELLYKSPTILLQLLRRSHSQADLIDILRGRQMAPPSVKVQVHLKGGPASIIAGNDPDLQWMKTTGKTHMDLSFDQWQDASQDPSSIQWQSGLGCWLFVVTEYRLADETTTQSVHKQVAEFQKLTLYDKYNYFMAIEYLQGIEQPQGKSEICEEYAEVQPELVLMKGEGMWFFNQRIYYVLLCLCLDSLYHLFFHLLVRRLRSYTLVKIMTRH